MSVSGKTVVVTGGSDGIGAAAARMLKARGAEVIVVGRSAEKTRAVADAVGGRAFVADYARLEEVRALAERLRAEVPRIDILINNAGLVMDRREETADGHEMTFQVNHLAPFLLTNLLIERLVEARASVITVSSVAHTFAKALDVEDLDLRRSYNGGQAYMLSKLENVLFTDELDRRYGEAEDGGGGISAASVHPGTIASNFARDTGGVMHLLYHTPLKHLFKTPEKGADTIVWLAEGEPGRDWQRGGYYAKRRPAKKNKLAADSALAARLWEKSAVLVGLRH